jgi:hypothetical protein
MTQLNGTEPFVVRLTDNTFSIKDIDGNDIDTTSYTAWSSGGTTKLLMYPRGVGFFGGRLFFGGSDMEPDRIYGSCAPDTTTGDARYDNFTVGTNAADAVAYTLSSDSGEADIILWIRGHSKSLLVGSTAGLRRVNGGDNGVAITPTAISSQLVEAFGVDALSPVYVGGSLMYMEKNQQTLRSYEFSFVDDDYIASDKSVLSDAITQGGVAQIAVTNGRPDIIWAAKNDGVLLSCTYLSREDVAGWAEHTIGGNGKVISICTESKSNNFDVLWACVERVVNGKIRRYMEYLAEDPFINNPLYYFSGDKTLDDTVYRALTFEEQKKFIRLDSALVLDTVQSCSLTLDDTEGDEVLATAGESIFKDTDVGRYIFSKFISGTETGVAQIVEYVSATEVKVNISSEFHIGLLLSGEWYFLVNRVIGLEHLEGKTVFALTDGGVHPPLVVENGSIDLSYSARYIIVGLPYTGFIVTLDLEYGADTGVAQGKARNINRIALKLQNTLGGRFGSNSSGVYGTELLSYRVEGKDYTDRPALLFTGVKEVRNFDTWDVEKKVYIVQDLPLPMTVVSITPFMDISEE